MNLVVELKSRFTTLNLIRLVLVIALIGEGVHSETWWMLAIASVLAVQLYLNKKCDTSC
jgi:fatty acid desaturase